RLTRTRGRRLSLRLERTVAMKLAQSLPAPTSVRVLAPGILTAALLALLSDWLAGGLGEPLARNPVLVAMLFGLALGNIFGYPDTLKPGLDFTKRYVLRLAVVLIGFRVTVKLLSELGGAPIAIAAVELAPVLS